MLIRSKAPLRLGLAGGGTDVSPYCDRYGGAVLNVTVNMYAYCTLEPLAENKIIFEATDRGERFECGKSAAINFDGNLDIHKAVYLRVIKDFNDGKRLSVKAGTYSEAPAGSGLGTSSTLVVCLLKAYTEWLRLPLSEYDIADLAYEIERVDLGLAGGRQDQYAAVFGGFNFMEFSAGKTLVNPLRIKKWIISELECSLVLYFTGVSRSSAQIISDQISKAQNNDQKSTEALNVLKAQAYEMKEAVLTGDTDLFCRCLQNGWNAKKNVSGSITNDRINETYDYIMKHGGRAAKISGAGGGGFMMIMCDPEKRKILLDALAARNDGGRAYTVNFDLEGSKAWTLR